MSERDSDRDGAPVPGTPRRGSGYFVARVAVLVLGVLVGFFGAFNAVFSDAFGFVDHLIAASAVFGMYVVAAFAAGLLAPRVGWRWALWLWLPGAVLLGLYTLREPQAAVWHATVLSVALAAALAGAGAGAALRRRAGRPRA